MLTGAADKDVRPKEKLSTSVPSIGVGRGNRYFAEIYIVVSFDMKKKSTDAYLVQ